MSAHNTFQKSFGPDGYVIDMLSADEYGQIRELQQLDWIDESSSAIVVKMLLRMQVAPCMLSPIDRPAHIPPPHGMCVSCCPLK